MVGEDDAVAGVAEDPGGLFPGDGAEIFAVQEDDGLGVFVFVVMPVAQLLRGDVHEGHFQVVALGDEAVELDGPGVGEVGPVEVIGERSGVDGPCPVILGGHSEEKT